MRIGLIDCDSKNKKNIFPNLSLMKIAAWHKQKGDCVEWYDICKSKYDLVYVSKVFSFSDDYDQIINADKVIYGGSGYAIRMEGGKEIYSKDMDKPLQYEIEHCFPAYEIYGINDTAYGFLTRGCPRGCDFCHVQAMQGAKAHKVADLKEFWNGQKNIVLLDPNITAAPEYEELFAELIESKATVDFSQGLDIRLLTDRKIELLKQVKIKQVHFAWDRYEDREIIVPRLERFKEITGWDRRKIVVYVLCGDRERKVRKEDLERIYTLRKLGCWPYVMLYDKESLTRGHELKKLQRWVNNRIIWEKIDTFEGYLEAKI